VDIVTLSDIEREYALVLSHLRLSGHLHDLHEHGGFLTPFQSCEPDVDIFRYLGLPR
jgi:hypothetical protein